MKRDFSCFVALLLAVVMFLLTATSARADSLNQSVNLPGFSTNYSTSTWGDSSTNFSASISNSDRITSASVSIYRDGQSDEGWVSINFYGDMKSPVEKDQESNSLSINRHGVSLYSYVNLGAQREYLGWDYIHNQPILGDWLSTGYAGLTISGVTSLYAYAQYNEYNFTDGGGKGSAQDITIPVVIVNTNWSENIQWRIRFDDAIIGKNFGLVPTGVSAGAFSEVPEPASLGVLALGGMALFARRRRG